MLSIVLLNYLVLLNTPAPFWRDLALITISFLMFIGTIYVFFRLRTSTFRRVRKLLEERVEVKTRQLVEKNKELEKLSLVASRTDNAVLIASPDAEIEWVNDGFIRLTGMPKEKVLGKKIDEIQVYNKVQTEIEQAIVEKHSRLFESNVTTHHLENIWISSTLTPIYDEAGKLKKLVMVDTNITSGKKMQQQIEQSLKEKEVLLKEIHHRVKNNLQIIISLLNLQSGYIKDELTLKAVKDGQNRVRSMALVHEKFYQAEELSEIDFGEYVEKLTQFLYQSYGDKTDRIKVIVESDHVSLDMDTAMPCGLLVNEIVSNAYKYAFPGTAEGEIKIKLYRADNKVIMKISDNGIGLPEGFSIEQTESLGMQLIQALTSQIDGELEVSGNPGTAFTVSFVYPKG
ncbi:MAG TPA: histidine kinase dimerization/phosphoacceptor domain -containing protein [Bacteroidia bacterium]|nr:histidine kinase dimerization/phosphoacceptor domain -containing protein [Bacteroidia bacterium]